MTSPYQPLDTLKPLADDIWIVDGPEISFYGLPFSTRMTVIRLSDGGMMLHSPTKLVPALRAGIEKLGPIRHLVSPNWIHYAYIGEWQDAVPGTLAWAAPGVRERARKHGVAVRFDRDLSDGKPGPWAGDVAQMLVRGSTVHREFVFFHKASKTLILTDLIENFEADKLPFFMGLVARIAGVAHPDGKMPPDMWLTFRRHRAQLRACVERMIAWQPARIVVAHGRCIERDCERELRRAFRGALAN